MALGSLAELSYALRLATDLGMMAVEDARELTELCEEGGKTTWGLYRYARRKATTHP